MALTAYSPLAQVYAFHETAERWILRRYTATVEEHAGAERTRGPWSESIVDVFPDRSSKSTTQEDAGQQGPATCTVYLRTRLLTTDVASVQPADVLFDPQARAWQASMTGAWDEAKGFAVTLVRNGVRGGPPWV